MVFSELSALAALAARGFEAAGVAVMVLGAVLALVESAVKRPWAGFEVGFNHFRNRLGAAILLGLELLVAADIIRTVSEEPTLRGVMVLGLIVIIRTFLSFTLTVELEGYWPWQRARVEKVESAPAERPSATGSEPE